MWINALVQAIDRSATPGENDILFGGGSATSVGNAIVCVCFDRVCPCLLQFCACMLCAADHHRVASQPLSVVLVS